MVDNNSNICFNSPVKQAYLDVRAQPRPEDAVCKESEPLDFGKVVDTVIAVVETVSDFFSRLLPKPDAQEAKSLRQNVKRFYKKSHVRKIQLRPVAKKKKSETVIVVATEEVKTETPKKDQKILEKVKSVNALTMSSPMAMHAETEEKKVAAKALLLDRTGANSALSISTDPRNFSTRSVQSAQLFSSSSPDSSDPVREIIREAVAQMAGLEDRHELAKIPVFVVGPWFMVHSPSSDFPGLWSGSSPMPPQILNKEGSVKIADFENGILETHTDANPMPSPKKFDALSFNRNSNISFSPPKRETHSGSEISNPLSVAQESVLSSEFQVAFVGFPVLASNGPMTMAPSHSSHRTEPLVVASTDPEPSQNGDSNNKDRGRENPEQDDGEDEEFPT